MIHALHLLVRALTISHEREHLLCSVRSWNLSESRDSCLFPMRTRANCPSFVSFFFFLPNSKFEKIFFSFENVLRKCSEIPNSKFPLFELRRRRLSSCVNLSSTLWTKFKFSNTDRAEGSNRTTPWNERT